MKNTNGSRFLSEISVTMYRRVLKCIISRSIYPPKEIIQAVAERHLKIDLDVAGLWSSLATSFEQKRKALQCEQKASPGLLQEHQQTSFSFILKILAGINSIPATTSTVKN